MGYRVPLDDDWQSRARTAEQELESLLIELHDYVQWLESPDRGPVIYRSEVAERLNQILD